LVISEHKIYTLRKEGECGTNGKNPGKGGYGGLNGFSGVFILKANNISHFIHDNSMKKVGTNGNHGQAGLGGYRGNSFERIYIILESSIIVKIFSFGFASFFDVNGYLSELIKKKDISGKGRKIIYVNKGSTYSSLDYHIEDGVFNMGSRKYPYPWDRSVPTQERCQSTHDGYNPKEKNSKSQIQPQNSQIDLNSHETEYLMFISNLELIESKLQERDFYKLLLKGNKTL
jgi:hypothetical protein